jgi:hypothetical protein
MNNFFQGLGYKQIFKSFLKNKRLFFLISLFYLSVVMLLFVTAGGDIIPLDIGNYMGAYIGNFPPESGIPNMATLNSPAQNGTVSQLAALKAAALANITNQMKTLCPAGTTFRLATPVGLPNEGGVKYEWKITDKSVPPTCRAPDLVPSPTTSTAPSSSPSTAPSPTPNLLPNFPAEITFYDPVNPSSVPFDSPVSSHPYGLRVSELSAGSTRAKNQVINKMNVLKSRTQGRRRKN